MRQRRCFWHKAWRHHLQNAPIIQLDRLTNQFDPALWNSPAMTISSALKRSMPSTEGLKIRLAAIRQSGQQNQFVATIPTANIQRWVGFSVSQILGIIQNVSARSLPVFFHCGQNVIACAVHDPVEAGNAVGRQTFPQHLMIGIPPATAAS